jgi:hypothetical protein
VAEVTAAPDELEAELEGMKEVVECVPEGEEEDEDEGDDPAADVAVVCVDDSLLAVVDEDEVADIDCAELADDEDDDAAPEEEDDDVVVTANPTRFMGQPSPHESLMGLQPRYS